MDGVLTTEPTSFYVLAVRVIGVHKVPQFPNPGRKKFYKYTPALQKSATMPKPPRMLAVVATAVSRTGKVSFGSLSYKYSLVTG